MRIIISLLALLIVTISFAQELPLNALKLPPGFSIDIYAAPVPAAREMTIGTKGTVFVGTMLDKVFALVPDANSPRGARVITIARGLNVPNGVAFSHGSLYVAEINRILRFDDIENRLDNPPKPVIITTALPDKIHHGMRFIRFGPDGKLYVGIGMPCNVCLQKDPRFGTIMRMNPDGSHFEIVVKGIRNSMGFDWDPISKKLWFTDNGRDMLGDNFPPDKLDYAPEVGMNFGFPFYNDKNLPDPIYGKHHAQKDFTLPTYGLPAHVAPLGMSFYTGNMFPASYRNQIFIAEHGSWNRSSKVGYQVITVKLANNHVIKVKPFVTGWLQGQEQWGRPVDPLVMPDGSLLISDDYAGVIYRVRYNKP
jgi:glucose/arabinose dehydrogenase